ncbi:LysR family transcriptional regulator [Vibrio sp. ZSDE26]|uniref:LysR family transcriptional regulator n=1 Tax=Vibrio amylolyticus TaxID=2847292 RepID=A0A9X1XJY2_9VIBR|nr:LysR family transcriptional regulator [Vibrio amylolyticus]MCK6263505.1 LysR family transcriptional regulator [Vibrio amylolyticus]
MTDSELEGIDFNSLKLLKILGEELNTKRAAERLYITQSGVSKALKKLRIQVNDPLFVREGNKLLTTDKCLRLMQKIPDIMESLDQLYNRNDTFDPSTYNGNITVHINAAIARPLMSHLFSRLYSEAPNATIILHSWTPDSEADLKQGIVDLGVNYYPLELSKEIIQTQIANPKLFLCCHISNPLLTKEDVTLQEITNYPFVLTQMPDFNRQQNQLIKFIRESGYQPKVAVRSDKIDVCLDTTRQIPSFYIMNELATHSLTKDLQLIDISHIEGIVPNPVGLFCSYRTADTPYQKWLNKRVEQCVQQLLQTKS